MAEVISVGFMFSFQCEHQFVYISSICPLLIISFCASAFHSFSPQPFSTTHAALGGSCMKMPFAIGGSGSTYIYGLLDSEFREGMTAEEAGSLVKLAISHAMARDGSSGGIIRTVTVTEEDNVREYIPGDGLPFGP